MLFPIAADTGIVARRPGKVNISPGRHENEKHTEGVDFAATRAYNMVEIQLIVP